MVALPPCVSTGLYVMDSHDVFRSRSDEIVVPSPYITPKSGNDRGAPLLEARSVVVWGGGGVVFWGGDERRSCVAEDLAALTCVTTDSTFRAANVVLLWDRDESGEY